MRFHPRSIAAALAWLSGPSVLGYGAGPPTGGEAITVSCLLQG